MNIAVPYKILLPINKLVGHYPENVSHCPFLMQFLKNKHNRAASSSFSGIQNPKASALPVAGLVTRQSFCTLLLRGHAAAVNHKKVYSQSSMAIISSGFDS